jgi:non-specific serine/threonine protein kinase
MTLNGPSPRSVASETKIGEDDGRRATFARQVRDALTYLHDPLYLQTHPLARLVAPDLDPRSSGVGKALRQVLLEAIDALHPLTGATGTIVSATGYQILHLRYVEALDVPTIQNRIALGRSEYYREQQRGVAAVVSVLWDRWQDGQQLMAETPGIGATSNVPVTESVPLPPRHNLPSPITTYVARSGELAQVALRLRESRLLTLTGAGGCGKTRLALEVAHDCAEQFSDGVWLVELASLADPGLVPQAIATALDLPEGADRPLLATVAGYLRPREVLLVLDNCEHLIEACAKVVDTLLRACPRLRTLATSRELLGIAGETVWRVPPLSLPDLRQPLTAGTLTQYEAVRLFLDRAVAVLPSFTVTDQNSPAVVQICWRLDGIPLAIELAAARVRMLTVEQIVARLDDQFRLLTGGGRATLPRQQTLRAAIDWSYDLLVEAERALLRRLSVFAGGWAVEAAEAIAAGEGVAAEVLDRLGALVDKSLVVAEGQGAQERYWMLETIRQYAEEKLCDSGEEAAIRDRHRDWYLDLAERAWPELTRHDQVRWLRRLDVEYDNLRTALRWCKSDGATAEKELRLAGALGRYWQFRGSISEGREWLDHALEHAERRPSVALALALNWAGVFNVLHYDRARARALAEESVAVSRAVDTPALLSMALRHLAATERAIGHGGRARELLGDALAAARSGDDARESAFGLASLGATDIEEGDLSLGRHRLEQAVSLARQSGDQSAVAYSLANLAYLECHEANLDRAQELFTAATTQAANFQWDLVFSAGHRWLAWIQLRRGDLAAAVPYTRAALRSARERGDRSTTLGALRVYAVLQEERGNQVAATRVYGLASNVDTAPGTNSSVLFGPRQEEERLAAVRAALGPDAFEAAWAEGQRMTLEQAIDDALKELG